MTSSDKLLNMYTCHYLDFLKLCPDIHDWLLNPGFNGMYPISYSIHHLDHDGFNLCHPCNVKYSSNTQTHHLVSSQVWLTDQGLFQIQLDVFRRWHWHSLSQMMPSKGLITCQHHSQTQYQILPIFFLLGAVIYAFKTSAALTSRLCNTATVKEMHNYFWYLSHMTTSHWACLPPDNCLFYIKSHVANHKLEAIRSFINVRQDLKCNPQIFHYVCYCLIDCIEKLDSGLMC